MPIFEFHCNDCGTDFEKLVFGSDPAVACPQCQQTNCVRLMSACNAKVGTKLTATSSGGGSSCTSCSATSCSTCH
ncbi:MAG: FmdB family zinc ribbon protein [Desulfobacca sp.]|uniref:FmdB family zinc ribbon protein n=1 Tax=Desulfobacca sp. TaxID=2067990 RepID=UPI00404A7881